MQLRCRSGFCGRFPGRGFGCRSLGRSGLDLLHGGLFLMEGQSDALQVVGEEEERGGQDLHHGDPPLVWEVALAVMADYRHD